MISMLLILSVLSLFFGALLLFNVERLKKLNQIAQHILWDDAWILSHRNQIGKILLGLGILLISMALYVQRTTG